MDASSEANLYLNYERQRYEATRRRPVLPVTLITGFLGAGKTTLLRKILRSKHNLRIAAMVNDFGAVDHDGGVVERDGNTDRVAKLAGGCVCCSGSLGGQLENLVAELVQRPDLAEDRYDYLVIETSGVTHPDSIIQALDRKFGKLTRARLDSVVAVVDGDFLFHSMFDAEHLAIGSLRRQLEQADVIIVNKSDLLDDEQLAGLAAGLCGINGSARIETCSYGNVPIHAVLDVELARTDIQGVSHERVAPHLSVSPTGGNLRATKGRTAVAQGLRSGRNDGKSGTLPEDDDDGDESHLRQDGLEEVTFVSNKPLALPRFQDWVSSGLAPGAIRAKGVITFDEDRLARSVFNMSGRRRMSYERDGEWQGPMRLHLVVIGKGIDKAAILSDLEKMGVDRSPVKDLLGVSVTNDAPDQLTRATDLLEASPLFHMVDSQADPECPRHVVRFRFTGEGVYGLTATQLSIKFGVDIDVVNRAIMREVNSNWTASAIPQPCVIEHGQQRDVDAVNDDHQETSNSTCPPIQAFLTCQEGVRVSRDAGEESCFVLRYALGGEVDFERIWPVVTERARAVMARDLRHVHMCNCFS